MTDAPPAAGTHAAHTTPDPPSEAAAAGDDSTTDDSITRAFSQSVVISGIRCMLAYVVFPWILPLLGVAKGVGPWIGIVVGVVAIGFNIASIRRFQMADHRWKWPITAINSSVIVLLLILLVEDVASIAG
jgi:hypothetical protein